MKRKYIYKLLVIFILSFLYSSFNIAILVFINKILLPLKEANLAIIVSFILLLVLFFISAYLIKYVIAKINHNMIYELRVRFVNRILYNKMIFNDKKPKILASLSKDINNISAGFMRLSDVLQGSILLVLSFLYFVYLSPKISIFVICWFVCIGLMVFLFMKKAKNNYAISRKYDDALYQDYEELLGGFKELRISRTRSKIFLDKFLNNANLQKIANIKAEIYGGLSSNLLNAMMLGGIGIVIYLSLGLGMANFETATTICISIMFLRAPFMMTIFSIPSIVAANISLEKVKELNLIEYENINSLKNVDNLKLDKIIFENIYFGYGKDMILKNISFEIKKGEIVFLVGKNGSGKSTLFLLMCGFLNPNNGRIIINDRELSNLNIAGFQNSLGVIYSDFYLFSEILNYNKQELEFWLKELKIENVVKFKIVNNILKFENLNLSSGQRKRVAFLQILLENKGFLLLDEFTSDQDPEFKEYFYNKILPFLKSKNITVFAICHDDRYFNLADKIYKIEDGNLQQI